MIDALTLTQLRVLIAVAETGSFSGAARRLGRVQSAISQTVQVLEETPGLTLFERAGKTPVLTEAGPAIAGAAQRGSRPAGGLGQPGAAIAGRAAPGITA